MEIWDKIVWAELWGKCSINLHICEVVWFTPKMIKIKKAEGDETFHTVKYSRVIKI